MSNPTFKAKTLKGNWVFGYYYEQKGKAYILQEDKAYEVRKETRCQITGMIDKKNKEIYEGEIVFFIKEINGSIIFKDKGIVKYRPDYATFVIHSDTGDEMIGFYERFIEVIGNKFDNKELLED